MTSVLVWVLVYSTHVYKGDVGNIIGDFATAEDCERVREELVTSTDKSGAKAFARCVQVRKVK